MCTRTYRKTSPQVLATLFGAKPPSPTVEARLGPDYNTAPTDALAAIRLNEQSERELVALCWGLLPPWEKDPRSGAKRVNARAETAHEKPSFRAAFERKRCLILVDGFYEWLKAGPKRRPHLFTAPSGAPLALAGLWERWEGEGAAIESATILTTTANALLAPLHHRMPVLLDERGQARWLAPQTEPPQLHALLAPCAPARLQVHEVDPRVNNVRASGEGLIAPVLTLPLDD